MQFSGVGRQKPKRYVIDIELFAPIDANASSWRFGSVGTVRFVLRKKAAGHNWARLTHSQRVGEEPSRLVGEAGAGRAERSRGEGRKGEGGEEALAEAGCRRRSGGRRWRRRGRRRRRRREWRGRRGERRRSHSSTRR